MLMVWIDAVEVYVGATLDDELLPAVVSALEVAASDRPKSFLLVALRNWELEVVARRVRLPREVRGLFTMPEGEAVDRLLGWEDGGGHWRPGLAGLQPAEARVLRLRVIDRRAVAEVAWALGVRERTVVNHMTEARRKLRAWFGLDGSGTRGVPSAARRTDPTRQFDPLPAAAPACVAAALAP